MILIKFCFFSSSTLILFYFCSDENVKPDEFMNLKKSHEVQAMSELISSVADYCGIKQVRVFPYIFMCLNYCHFGGYHSNFLFYYHRLAFKMSLSNS